MKNKKAGALAGQPASTKSSIRMIPPVRISRKAFLRDCAGRLITVGVAMAAYLGNDQLVDRLLRLKNQHNKGARP